MLLKHPFSHPKRTTLFALLALLILLTALTPQQPTLHTPTPRLLKATTLYPSSPHLYTRALALHETQNKACGYETRVQRAPITRGGAGVFEFLAGIIRGELEKGDIGGEWIFYHAPTLLPRPSTCLDTLLPPAPAAADGTAHEALKQLLFIVPSPEPDHTTTPSLPFLWLRVTPLTLRILAAATSALHERDSHRYGGAGSAAEEEEDVVAVALHGVLAKHKARGAEGEVVVQPRGWYGVSSGGGGSAVDRVQGGGREVAVFAHPGYGGAFAVLRRLGALVERIEKEQGDASGEVGVFEEAVGAWWARVMEERKAGGY